MLNVPLRFHPTIGYLIVLTISVALPVRATPPTPEFMAWWNRLLEGGRTGPSMDGYILDYTVTDLRSPPTTQEIEAIRNEIGSDKQHPLHSELAMLEYRRDKGPITSRYRLWKHGDSWRWSNDPPDPAGIAEYVDKVWTPKYAWQLTAHALVQGDPPSITESQYRIDVSASGIAHDISLFANGQLAATLGSVDARESLRLRSDGWRLRREWTLPDGTARTLDAGGSWNDVTSNGTLDYVERNAKPPSGPAREERMNLSEWKSLEGSSVVLAGRVEIIQSKVPRRRYDLHVIAPVSKREFDELVRLPRPAVPDPVRGTLTYRSVTELRKDQESVGVVENGKTTVMSRKDIGLAGHSKTVRVAGWIAAVGLTASIVVLRFMKRGRA